MAENNQPTKGYPTVTELAPPGLFEGEYREVKQLVGQRILVKQVADYRGKQSDQYAARPTLVVSGMLEDETGIFFFCNHEVLYHKLDWLRDKTPFVAVIHKPEGARYYDVK